MTATCFQITRLALTGLGVPNAEVRFRNGLNVIVGPSNTGKTFIAQCIDFALGAGTRPNEIPQAASYDSVELDLLMRDSRSEVTLKRSLLGGHILVGMNGLPDRILLAKHRAGKKNSLSHFLLAACGLAGKRLRRNGRGQTRDLSFRDLSKLILVDEESVISEESPIFSGQRIDRTTEISVFRLLLTGVDDSSIVEADDPRVVGGRKDGKAEVIELLLDQAHEQIAELNIEGDLDSLRKRFERLQESIDIDSRDLAAEREAITPLEERRRTILVGLRQTQSRMDVLSQLQNRFVLLKQQYSSDLRRLEAISETASQLQQMKEERCPVCGALAEHHEQQHKLVEAAPSDVSAACVAEASKVRALEADLQATLADNADEIGSLSEEIAAKQSELESVGTEIQDRVRWRIEGALQRFGDHQAELSSYRYALELNEQVERLKSILVDVEDAPSAQYVTVGQTGIGTDEAEPFTKEVEDLLRSWHFPYLDRVTFSERDQDVVISGQRRGSHGKGVRAITHAAFTLGLLKYCLNRSMPHPGFAVIDSPLVVYREPDITEEGFPLGVKDAFYTSLAHAVGESQVIVLENDGPTDDVHIDAAITRFTGTNEGRFGFIPRPEESLP